MADNSTTIANGNLDQFYSGVISKEPSARLECFSTLESYLSDENASLECDDMPGFVSGLLKWVEGSNFRVMFYSSCDWLSIVRLIHFRLLTTVFEYWKSWSNDWIRLNLNITSIWVGNWRWWICFHRQYVYLVVTASVDRLGDAKDQVRRRR